MLQHRPTPSACPKRRALALILGATGLLVLLATGITLSLAALLHPTSHADPQTPRIPIIPIEPAAPQPISPEIAAARDALAARPMPDTGTGGAYGPQISTRDPGTPINLPPGTQIGAFGAVTGYPHTPQGALAQLAAIDVAAFRSASMPGVRAVIRSWAAPGGPTPQAWSGVKAMASLLESIDVPGSGSPGLHRRLHRFHDRRRVRRILPETGCRLSAHGLEYRPMDDRARSRTGRNAVRLAGNGRRYRRRIPGPAPVRNHSGPQDWLACRPLGRRRNPPPGPGWVHKTRSPRRATIASGRPLWPRPPPGAAPNLCGHP